MCMRACACACVCVCVRVCVCACVWVWVWVCMCVCVKCRWLKFIIVRTLQKKLIKTNHGSEILTSNIVLKSENVHFKNK